MTDNASLGSAEVRIHALSNSYEHSRVCYRDDPTNSWSLAHPSGFSFFAFENSTVIRAHDTKGFLTPSMAQNATACFAATGHLTCTVWEPTAHYSSNLRIPPVTMRDGLANCVRDLINLIEHGHLQEALLRAVDLRQDIVSNSNPYEIPGKVHEPAQPSERRKSIP
jgi:hypothetical protein